MPVRPYLLFDGNAREAIEFYESVFNTNVESLITFGEMPQNPEYPLPDEVKQRVWLSQMRLAGDLVQISDIGPFPGFVVGNNVDVFYIEPSVDEISRIYGRLIEGGSAQVELDLSSDTKAYANVKDKFGIAWQLSTTETISQQL
jgi:PhnB protein